MSVFKTQKEINQLRATLSFRYPLLREPGLFTSTKFGRAVLKEGEILALFNEKDPMNTEDHLISAAIYITAKRLIDVFSDKRFTPNELPKILNQHFNLAELLLLHHTNRIPGLYERNIDGIEEKRGEYLEQLAIADDGNAVCWTEYAYWLLGSAEKQSEVDANKAVNLRQQAETWLRKAHQVGYVEATEALATHIYTTTDNVGAALFYWEKAAVAGNTMGLQNLFNVMMADPRLTPKEFTRSLSCLWQGISANKKETVEVAKLLKEAGFGVAPKPSRQALVPA